MGLKKLFKGSGHLVKLGAPLLQFLGDLVEASTRQQRSPMTMPKPT